jgi:hypothetical protein
MTEKENKPLTVTQAMNLVMKEVGAIAKKDKNQAQGFNFRGIDSVVNAVSPALQRHGIVVIPTVETYEYNTVEIGKNRTAMGHVKVKVSYSFISAGGDAIKATVVGEAMDSGDKATAKAMSVAFRTALLQSLSLPTHEPDPDAQSYERSNASNVLAPSAVLMKITQATELGILADIGAYITQNKEGYDQGILNQFRTAFAEQQKKLNPIKPTEETKTDSTEFLEEDTNETTTEEPVTTVDA